MQRQSFVLRAPFLCFILASLVTVLLLILCDKKHYKCCSRLCCKLLSSKMTFIKVNNWNKLWQLLISTITQSAHILAALGILNQSIIIDLGKWCSKVSIRCLCEWREGIWHCHSGQAAGNMWFEGPVWCTWLLWMDWCLGVTPGIKNQIV